MPEMAELTIATVMHVVHRDIVARLQVTDPFAAIFDLAGIFMTKSETSRQLGSVGLAAVLAAHDIQIRAAQACTAHADQHFTRAGGRIWHVDEFRRLAPLTDPIGLPLAASVRVRHGIGDEIIADAGR